MSVLEIQLPGIADPKLHRNQASKRQHGTDPKPQPLPRATLLSRVVYKHRLAA